MLRQARTCIILSPASRFAVPARACLQTGLYATETGCYRNGVPLPSESRTLAHHFADAGYDTAYIGKWHLADGAHGPVAPEQRGGYDYWLASNLLEFTSDAYDLGDVRQEWLAGGSCRVIALTPRRDAAIRYIDEHQESPFFLFLSYIEPHHQNHRDDYPAPPGYAERYRGRWLPPDLAALGGSSHQQMAGYLGMIKRLDEALGRLVDALISLDMLEDTIIFSSHPITATISRRATPNTNAPATMPPCACRPCFTAVLSAAEDGSRNWSV